MPFESKKQQRWMFAAEERGEVPKGTAKRWARHTPDIKSLPEEKKDSEKDAFVRQFKQAFVELVGGNVAEFAMTKQADELVKFASTLEQPEALGIKPKSKVKVIKQPKGGGGADDIKGYFLGLLGAGAVPGLAAGGALASLTSPSSGSIDNLQRGELINAYDDAVNEVTKRILLRKMRGE